MDQVILELYHFSTNKHNYIVYENLSQDAAYIQEDNKELLQIKKDIISLINSYKNITHVGIKKRFFNLYWRELQNKYTRGHLHDNELILYLLSFIPTAEL